MAVQDIDLTGKQIGHYQIISKLGSGGMATVYKAHEQSLSRTVAFKVLRPELSEDAAFIKRFEREAKAVAQLNHPNIVQIYAIGEEQGLHYFAMEYIQGKSLAQVIKEEGALPPKIAIPMIRQAAEGLAAAHKAKLIHRDIKPSNLMIDASGKIKIADFGIARVSQSQTKLTQDGSFLGTPEYISPEICQEKEIDGRADLFSLGVTFYEMLTGQTPFKGETPVNTLMKIVEGKFRPLSEIKADIPQNVQAVVEKMMHRDRDQRHQSAEEVIRAIDELEGGPVEKIEEAVPVMAAEPPSDTIQARGKKKGIFAAIIILLLVVGGAFAAWYFTQKKGKSENTIDPALQLITQNLSGADQKANEGSGEISTGNTPAKQSTDQTQSTSDTQVQAGIEAQKADTAANSQEKSGSDLQADAGIQQKNATAEASQDNTARSPSNPSEIKIKDTKQSGQNSPESVTGKPAQQEKSTARNQGVVVTMVGDQDKSSMLQSYIEPVLRNKGLTVFDENALSPSEVNDRAGYRLISEIRQVATNTLTYYGHSTEQYTVAITMKLIVIPKGNIVAGPVTKTVQYTALNIDENLKPAVKELARTLIERLKGK